MSELPPYKKNASCPKCGGKHVRVYYHGPTCGVWGCDNRREGEHLGRRCETCNYAWNEAVLP